MDRIRCRFFLRGPLELVNYRDDGGRAVRRLKEEAESAGIEWPPGCVMDVDPALVIEGIAITLVELTCSTDEALSLSEKVAALFEPASHELKLGVYTRGLKPGERHWDVVYSPPSRGAARADAGLGDPEPDM